MARLRPRVAMVVAGDVFGGAERQVLTLVKAGAGRFDSTIFTTLPGPFAAAARAAFLAVEDVARPGRAAGVLATAAVLRERLRCGGFELVHTHGYRAAVIASLAARGRLPVVRTVHGAPEARLFSAMGLHERLGYAAGWLGGATNVFVSQELARRLSRRRSPCVIYNGADGPSATPAPRVPGERFRFVAVGRLEPVKGLVNAIRALADPALRAAACLHLIGEGPEEAALRAEVARHGLGDTVHFDGFQADAPARIAAADALLLPSLHEGIPYVLLEALWRGTPVIASRVGGIPEVVRDGREALLVPSADPPALVAAARRLIGDPALRESLRTGGYARVREAFSASAMVEAYAALYTRKLAR